MMSWCDSAQKSYRFCNRFLKNPGKPCLSLSKVYYPHKLPYFMTMRLRKSWSSSNGLSMGSFWKMSSPHEHFTFLGWSRLILKIFEGCGQKSSACQDGLSTYLASHFFSQWVQTPHARQNTPTTQSMYIEVETWCIRVESIENQGTGCTPWWSRSTHVCRASWWLLAMPKIGIWMNLNGDE
jgi:hypothetical protein